MDPTLFVNALIFDGHTPDLIADRYVLVVDGRIAIVGRERPDRRDVRVVDLAGKVLMPGLIDCHFHAYACRVDLAELESLPVSYLAQRGRVLLENALRRGFTSVRDAGGADYGLWRSIEEGVFPGPRLFYSGRALSQTGGHVDARPQHVEPCGCLRAGNLGMVVDGVDALRRVVRETLRQGAHQIKIMVSGGIASPTDPVWMLQYADEEIAVVVDEAARRRSYVMAHAYTAETIARAVKLGVRSIEHANLIDRNAAEAVAARDAFVVPTLVTYEALGQFGKQAGAPRTMIEKLVEVREQGKRAVEICSAAGVRLGLGTDLLGDMHVHQLDELRIRGEIQSPFEVLHSATAINAAILQRPGELGCIREGALADFLVVDGNPLEDLALLHSKRDGLHAVYKDGRLVGPSC